ncbi:NlpC/P60 family protein [Streptomyces sp. NRRL S-31]|uniref:NlpC/P60 family protein n=1 Tax=Streptomyces sp. NRRL S-31 TaxID=1463898 RepID=UPI0004C98904|nr:NlpC/P60 family protein [Streptomyces sp. NRRL S-31]
MASHRKPRPGGTQAAGIRTPALATAALASVSASVSVLSQAAEAALPAGHRGPSVEEVERKIEDLYRRAESAAGSSAASRLRTARPEATERAECARPERTGPERTRSGRGERAWPGRSEQPAGRAERAWSGRTEQPAGRGERAWPGRTEQPAGRGERTEPAEAPPRREDSLQRLRDEVARRARHRALPTRRAMIPAQRVTSGDERGTGREEFGTRRDERGTGGREGAAALAGGTTVTPPVPDKAATSPAPGSGIPAPSPGTTAATFVTGTTATSATAPAHPQTPHRPAETASGPRAAKTTVRNKLAHARVLLSRRAIQPAAAMPPATYATKAGKAIDFARAQLGKPCVWGAAGPGSYDCAGLTQAAWKSAGVTLPRTAREQAGAGMPVPPAEARPGDLVLFHDDAAHVGLCTGDGMMIHAPMPGAYVREEPVSALGGGAVHSVVRPG